MEVTPRVAQGRAAHFRVRFYNQANREAALNLAAQDAEEKLDFLLKPDDAGTVPPVRVSPRRL